MHLFVTSGQNKKRHIYSAPTTFLILYKVYGVPVAVYFLFFIFCYYFLLAGKKIFYNRFICLSVNFSAKKYLFGLDLVRKGWDPQHFIPALAIVFTFNQA